MSKKKIKQYLGIVLDESGSMTSLRQFAKDSVNEQLQTARAQDEFDVKVTLITFNYDIHIHQSGADLKHFDDIQDCQRAAQQNS